VGIPIIATDVGGNSEIVTNDNGLLLSCNPNPIEIAEAIKWFTKNPIAVKAMRENSRRLFLGKYDSKKVYPEFIRRLIYRSELH
jgi:colanic acid/amylovoran biosynthesis glycosyltransferase